MSTCSSEFEKDDAEDKSEDQEHYDNGRYRCVSSSEFPDNVDWQDQKCGYED
jgi:hypothetical protein